MTTLIKNRCLKDFDFHGAPVDTVETLEHIYNKATQLISLSLSEAENTVFKFMQNERLAEQGLAREFDQDKLPFEKYQEQWAEICERLEQVLTRSMQVAYTAGVARGMAEAVAKAVSKNNA